MTHTDESAVQGAYDAVADLYADHFRSTEPEQPIDLAMIEDFAGCLGPASRVLDAGCGAGRMLPVLAALGCEVEGVDLSSGMIRRARTDHGDFRTRVGSLLDLPYQDASFDGLFSWYSTIHNADADLPVIFGEAHRVLRESGLLLIAFQTGDGAREIGQVFRDRGYDVRLTRHHRSADHVARLLNVAGFSVIASLDREPAGVEADGQAVLIAQRAT